jgi:hypothetical protein
MKVLGFVRAASPPAEKHFFFKKEDIAPASASIDGCGFLLIY